jgi:hypothetical protein
MKLDSLTMHSDDLGSVVGEFYGTPIRQYYPEMVERREEEDLMQIVRASIKARGSNVKGS